jgi:hypothetical protein
MFAFGSWKQSFRKTVPIQHLISCLLPSHTEYTECQAFYKIVRIGSPRPLPARECCSPPLGPMGETHLRGRGWGGQFRHWDRHSGTLTLQRHNTENSKQIFPGKELRVLNPGFWERFIYSYHRSAYFATGKYVDWSWEYINRSHTRECGNWDWGHAVSFLGTHKWDFRWSAVYFNPSTLFVFFYVGQ